MFKFKYFILAKTNTCPYDYHTLEFLLDYHTLNNLIYNYQAMRNFNKVNTVGYLSHTVIVFNSPHTDEFTVYKIDTHV